MLNPDYGSTALLKADPKWSEAQIQDMLARDRAAAIVAALNNYRLDRQAAFMAEQHGDIHSADRCRAMARAELHLWPELAAMMGEAVAKAAEG